MGLYVGHCPSSRWREFQCRVITVSVQLQIVQGFVRGFCFQQSYCVCTPHVFLAFKNWLQRSVDRSAGKDRDFGERL